MIECNCLELKPRQVAFLERLSGQESLTARLLDMGFHPGVEVEVFQKMPFGGPLIIRVNAGLLALRGEEAQCLIVRI